MSDTAIDLGSWEITDAAVRGYLDAVGDPLTVYRDTGMAPPLLLAARVVGLLLARLSLPAGAVHSRQEVTTLAALRIGAQVSATAQVEATRERGSMRFLTVNYTAADIASGSDLLRGRTTVLLPAAGAPGAAHDC